MYKCTLDYTMLLKTVYKFIHHFPAKNISLKIHNVMNSLVHNHDLKMIPAFCKIKPNKTLHVSDTLIAVTTVTVHT